MHVLQIPQLVSWHFPLIVTLLGKSEIWSNENDYILLMWWSREWAQERTTIENTYTHTHTPIQAIQYTLERWNYRMMTSHIIIQLDRNFGFCYLICLAVIFWLFFLILRRLLFRSGIRFNFHSHRLKCDCWWKPFWWTGKKN